MKQKFQADLETSVNQDNPRPNSIYYRLLDDHQELVIYQMLFTARLCIGVPGEGGCLRAWCYPDAQQSIRAAEAWDGSGDPPDGWVKEVGTERRRKP